MRQEDEKKTFKFSNIDLKNLKKNSKNYYYPKWNWLDQNFFYS